MQRAPVLRRNRVLTLPGSNRNAPGPKSILTSSSSGPPHPETARGAIGLSRGSISSHTGGGRTAEAAGLRKRTAQGTVGRDGGSGPSQLEARDLPTATEGRRSGRP